MIQITLNGINKSLKEDCLLNDMLQSFSVNIEHGVAVCINDEVLPKSSWNNQRIKEGDVIEIVQASQGG